MKTLLKWKKISYNTTTIKYICGIFVPNFTKMEETKAYISSASIKEQGRTAYYKMLERVREGELIQVRRGVYATIDWLSSNVIDVEAIVPGTYWTQTIDRNV